MLTGRFVFALGYEIFGNTKYILVTDWFPNNLSLVYSIIDVITTSSAIVLGWSLQPLGMI